MDLNLHHRTAIVTGGATGLGKEFVLSLAREGVNICFTYMRDEERPEQLIDTVKNSASVEIIAVKTDLSDEQSRENLFATCIERLGNADILVNNAGITRDNLFMRMSDEEWAQVIDVNLTASFRLMRGVLRGMMKARWGRIVNITSVVGATGNPGQANYAAAKAGLVGMSKSLAYEVASRGITVNCVAPGFIATAMTDKLNDDQKGKILTQIPAGTMGAPTDIAAAVLYLSSPEAGYVTGATLHVNGGMAMV